MTNTKMKTAKKIRRFLKALYPCTIYIYNNNNKELNNNVKATNMLYAHFFNLNRLIIELIKSTNRSKDVTINNIGDK